MLTGDPCDPIFQVRLIIGDTSGDLISDELIAYALEKNSNSLRGSSIEVLTWLIASVASEMNHSVGEVYLDNRKLYDQFVNLLNKVKNDGSYVTKTSGIIIGGTSKSKVEDIINDTDVKSAPISVGFYAG